ncbi:MAG: glycosyltransferase family 2 protein [Clostridium sp.]
MKNIKVTVIMPVYNAAEYLRESLDCLTKQTLQDIEIICVDDGSTDESLCILEEYSKKDNRFMVLSQKNLHAGVARNNGIDHASGEYMIFLDADDLFELELLEKTYKQGIQQDADIVLFDADYFNTETGERLVQNHLLRTELLDGKEVFSRKDIPDRLFTITTTCPWTKLYSRKFIEKYKLRFSEFKA